MIQAITRFVLVAAGLVSGFAVSGLVDWQAQYDVPQYYVIFLFIILGGAVGYVIGGIVGRELTVAWGHVENRLSGVSTAEMILGTVGLVTGLLVALLLLQPLRLVQPVWLAIGATLIASIVLAYLGLKVALTRRREFVAMFPRLAPADLISADERALLLDTSAVIDGRFLELHRIGFMPGVLRVPRFVLAELQTLADSADDARRSRGRRGLDMLAALKPEEAIDVFEVDYPDTPLVDEKLMRLSVDTDSTLVTVDFNLSKVARVRGIHVLNLNDAAAALKPSFLPGETVCIRIAKPGKEPDQGVGYLEDGTMVVVQAGRQSVGSDREVEVTSVLQTSAGRMIFARLAAEEAVAEDGA